MPRVFFLLLPALLLPLSGWSMDSRSPALAALSEAGPAPVVGHNEKLFLQSGDTLIRLARINGLGYRNLVDANPGIDPWLPPAGRLLVLPYASVMPARPQTGITVNLADQRLYLVGEGEAPAGVRVYPVGVGVEGWNTPEGDFTVREKIVDPSWTVPAGLRQEDPELPPYVPPGRDNPLGAFWIGFSTEGYGIHGTNRPYGIGRRVSHGCIRLYPEDIRDLFGRVSLGTPVRIVYRPIKVGIRDGRLLVEIHRDFLERIPDPQKEVRGQVAALAWKWPIDQKAVDEALRQKTGIPTPISSVPRIADSDGNP